MVVSFSHSSTPNFSRNSSRGDFFLADRPLIFDLKEVFSRSIFIVLPVSLTGCGSSTQTTTESAGPSTGANPMKEAMNLSFGGMKGVSKTILTGVDHEAAQLARRRSLIRGGHDETPVTRLKDVMSGWPSVHGSAAASRAAGTPNASATAPTSAAPIGKAPAKPSTAAASARSVALDQLLGEVPHALQTKAAWMPQ